METDLPAVREQLEGEVRAVTVHDEDDRVIFRQPRQRRFHAALDVLDAQVISDPALVYLSRSSRVRSSQVGGVVCCMSAACAARRLRGGNVSNASRGCVLAECGYHGGVPSTGR